MDKRATHTPIGTVDVHPAVSVEMRNRAQRTSIDGAGQHDTTDLTKVLQAIAARIDVVLDEKVAAGAEPEGRHRAARAWSPVIGKRTAEGSTELRRHALATTVLKISADGRLDIDDRKRDDLEHEDRQGGISDVVAEVAGPTEAETEAEGRQPSDARSTADRTVATAAHASKPESVDGVSVRGGFSAASAPAATDRSDVEDRLRTARQRLEARRTAMTATHVDASGTRAPRRARRPVLRRTEVRTVVQRLLIGLAIVGASAVVSILVT